jgi:hypothetical protein
MLRRQRCVKINGKLTWEPPSRFGGAADTALNVVTAAPKSSNMLNQAFKVIIDVYHMQALTYTNANVQGNFVRVNE